MNHTIALTADGTIYSWGNNEYGQLGDGTYISKYLPEEIKITENDEILE